MRTARSQKSGLCFQPQHDADMAGKVIQLGLYRQSHALIGIALQVLANS